MSETNAEILDNNALVPDEAKGVAVAETNEAEVKPDVKLTYPQVHDAAKFLMGHAKERIFALPEFKEAAAKGALGGNNFKFGFNHDGQTFDLLYFGGDPSRYKPGYESISIKVYPSPSDPWERPSEYVTTQASIKVADSPSDYEQNRIKGIQPDVSWITFQSPDVYKLTKHDRLEYREDIRDTQRTLDELAQFINKIK